jgi:exosortase/archaeosortase family protein
MDDGAQLRRNILALLALVGIAEFADFDQLLSSIMRPLVVATAQIFGIDAIDHGTGIALGKVLLPWTQDCSGVNTLLILWGACIWFSRDQRFGLALFLRLACCVPAALAANLLRILSIALYRYIAYPEAESVELHYLLGFLWLVPFLALLVKDFRRPGTAEWLEIVYVVVLLSLLASVVFDPGGTLVTVCAVFWLSQSNLRVVPRGFPSAAYVLWLGSAVVIAWLRMESLWIPWLLLCPRFVPMRLLSSPTGLIVLAGTIPIVAMHSVSQLFVMVSLAWEVWRALRQKRIVESSATPVPDISMASWKTGALAIFAFAPFFLPYFVGVQSTVELPPAGVMSKRVTPNGYQLRVMGQPAGISMFWYSAFSDGRHHAVEACMRFRGILLEEVDGEGSVLVGDNKWFREFFIQNDALASSYGEYVVGTLRPFSDVGVHIIIQAPMTEMSASYFAMQSEMLAARIFRIREDSS